jgi:hypothetical protein
MLTVGFLVWLGPLAVLLFRRVRGDEAMDGLLNASAVTLMAITVGAANGVALNWRVGVLVAAVTVVASIAVTATAGFGVALVVVAAFGVVLAASIRMSREHVTPSRKQARD